MAERFNWSGYLQLAEELGKRSDEASLRSALSRAYYYVYHLALERAEANDFKPIPGEWKPGAGLSESGQPCGTVEGKARASGLQQEF